MRRLFLAVLIWSAAAPTAAWAQGGFGFQGDLAVTYSFLKGGRLTDKLQDMEITRSGPFLGLQARW